MAEQHHDCPERTALVRPSATSAILVENAVASLLDLLLTCASSQIDQPTAIATATPNPMNAGVTAKNSRHDDYENDPSSDDGNRTAAGRAARAPTRRWFLLR